MSLSIEKNMASRIFGKKRREKLSRCFLKGGIAHFVHRMSHFEITHDSLKPSLPDPKQLRGPKAAGWRVCRRGDEMALGVGRWVKLHSNWCSFAGSMLISGRGSLLVSNTHDLAWRSTTFSLEHFRALLSKFGSLVALRLVIIVPKFG